MRNCRATKIELMEHIIIDDELASIILEVHTFLWVTYCLTVVPVCTEASKCATC